MTIQTKTPDTFNHDVMGRSTHIHNSLIIMSELKKIVDKPVYYIEYDDFIHIYMLYDNNHIINIDGYQDATRFFNTLRNKPQELKIKELTSDAEQSIKNKYAHNTEDDYIKHKKWEAYIKNSYRFKYIVYPYKLDDILKELDLNKDIALLSYLPNEIINNKELMLQYLKNHGGAYRYVGENLRNDLDIITTAIEHNGIAFRDVPDAYRNNKSLILKAIETASSAFKEISPELKKDKDFVLSALKRNNSIFQYIDETFTKDKDFCLTAIENTPHVFSDPDTWYRLDSVLKQDLEIILTALIKAPYLYTDINTFCNDTLTNNPIIKFIKDHGPKIPTSDWKIIKHALLHNPDLFLNPPASIQTLCEDMNNKYLYFAQYAISKLSNVLSDTDMPELPEIVF